MNELEEALWEAWERVGKMLEGNPDEMKVRLARRRSRMFSRPMRVFCLAIKASDRRINPVTAAICPEDAAYPGHSADYGEHTVVVDKRLLLKLCEPVEVEPGGEPWWEVARRLGCGFEGIRALIRNGTLRVEYYKGYMRRWGKGAAIVYCDEPLDPAAFGKQRPDPIWGGLWRWRAAGLAEDFSADLVRVPEWAIRGGRKIPMGWRWICPGCGERVRTVYLPRPAPDWGAYVGLKVKDEVDAVPAVNGCFGCNRCHGVLNFSRAGLRRSWNQLVLRYSGGLMYGREVKRPGWLVEGRKRVFVSRPKEAKRREELTRWLVETRAGFGEIAGELGVKRETVRTEASRIYRRHGVQDREGLRTVVPGRREVRGVKAG